MKNSIFLYIILLILVVMVIYFKFSTNKVATLEKKWTALVNSKDNIEEVKKIEDLSNYMKGKAFFILVGINKQGEEKSIAYEKFDINNLKEVKIEVTFRDAEKFTGIGWKPKNNENPFIFFRE